MKSDFLLTSYLYDKVKKLKITINISPGMLQRAQAIKTTKLQHTNAQCHVAPERLMTEALFVCASEMDAKFRNFCHLLLAIASTSITIRYTSSEHKK